MRLLLVEDSARLRDLVSETIREVGWSIDGTATLQDARAALASTAYDALLLDLGMPDGDGLELVRELRRRRVFTPVLVLTARGAVDERVMGLDAGADDYLVKPFNNRELLARVRALIRRGPLSSAPILEAGALRFDPGNGALSCRDHDIPLAPRERALLELLMRNVGRVTRKQRIEESLSEFGDEVSPNAIELVLSRLRRKLAVWDPHAEIETVRGVGYLLREIAP